jgi:hypothetical protein
LNSKEAACRFVPACGTFLEISHFENFDPVEVETMPNSAFRRWTADEIAKLKNMAQKQRAAEIAAQLGRSAAATALKAHELKLSLRVPRKSVERVADGPASPSHG